MFAKVAFDIDCCAPEISGKPAWDQQRNIKVTFADTYPMDTLPKQSSETKSYVFMLVAPYQMKSRFSTKGITQDLGLTFLVKNLHGQPLK